MERLLLFGILLLLTCSPSCGFLVAPPPLPSNLSAAALQVGFYDKTCPRAEAIVQAQMQKQFSLDNTIAPALLRMLFHDSFVRGVDASILLDSTPGHEAEKEALPNLTIRGFDVIGNAKEAVESVCPGVVSCADIIVMAVRDCVALAGGPKYDVPTGRLDGLVSSKDDALNLPSPAFPVEQSAESFREKGLDLEDMVVLLGAHTVGVALCGFFNDRLFNFRGTGLPDPTMNTQLVTRLSAVCPNPFFTESNADPAINLDQGTPAIFDSVYFTQILQGNGILEIDQEISADPTTLGFVQSFTSSAIFFPAFARSIVKMGNIEVLTGNNVNGEIRRKCNVVNSNSGTPTAKPPSPGPTPGPASKPGTPTAFSPPAAGGLPSPVSKSAPPGHVGTPPVSVRPAPAGHTGTSPASGKPVPSAHVGKPPAPVPAGHVSTPPSTSKPPPASGQAAPPSHVSTPPASGKPTPPAHESSPVGGGASKPPAASKPRPSTPSPKPGEHAIKPPAPSKRIPGGKAPATPRPTPAAPKTTPAAAKPAPPAPTKSVPRGKAPASPQPSPASPRTNPAKPVPRGKAPASPQPSPAAPRTTPAAAKPAAPPGRVTKARQGAGGGRGKSPIPAPPFGHGRKLPITPPLPPGSVSKGPPAGHVSRPARPPPL